MTMLPAFTSPSEQRDQHVTGPKNKAHFRLSALRLSSNHGWLTGMGRQFACHLGAGGRQPFKREGDDAGPTGRFYPQFVCYRADRVTRPHTRLPLHALRPEWGWCDDPGHPRYNMPVMLPFPFSHEKLWRQDNLYDLLLVIDHNIRPTRHRCGSAVFLHLSANRPTAGCLAFSQFDFRRLLGLLDTRSVIEFGPGPSGR